jgi:hypothetical protein
MRTWRRWWWRWRRRWWVVEEEEEEEGYCRVTPAAEGAHVVAHARVGVREVEAEVVDGDHYHEDDEQNKSAGKQLSAHGSVALLAGYLERSQKPTSSEPSLSVAP